MAIVEGPLSIFLSSEAGVSLDLTVARCSPHPPNHENNEMQQDLRQMHVWEELHHVGGPCTLPTVQAAGGRLRTGLVPIACPLHAPAGLVPEPKGQGEAAEEGRRSAPLGPVL